MKIFVQVSQAKNLTAHYSHSGNLNPLCEITLVDSEGKSIIETKQKTSVRKKTFNPVWDDLSYEFTPSSKITGLRFKCISKELVQKHTIGKVVIPLEKFKDGIEKKWVSIEKGGSKSGELQISIHLVERQLEKTAVKKALDKHFHLSVQLNDIIDEIWCRKSKRKEYYQGSMIITNTHFCFRSDKKAKILDKIPLANIMNICIDNSSIEIFEESSESHHIKSYKFDDFSGIDAITLIINTWENATKRKANNNQYIVANDVSSEPISSHSSSLRERARSMLGDHQSPSSSNSASADDHFAVKLALKTKDKKKKSIRNIFTRRKKFDNENILSHSPDRSADNHLPPEHQSQYTEETDNTLNDHEEIGNIDLNDSGKNEIQTCIGTCNVMVKYTSEPNSEKKNLFIRVVECHLNLDRSKAQIGDFLQLTFTVDNSISSFTKIYPLDSNFSLSIKEDLIFDLKKDPKKLRISLTNAATSEEVGVCIQPLNIQEKSIDSWQLKLYNRLPKMNEEEEDDDEEDEEDEIDHLELITESTLHHIDPSEDPSINISYEYIPNDSSNKNNGLLTITVHKCANLLMSPSIGEKNYFVRLTFGEYIETTTVQSGSLDPKFNESFKYELKKKEEKTPKRLEVSVWNCNSHSKFALIGQLTFYLDKLELNKSIKSWYSLSIVSDLSALSAADIEKVAEQAREIDEFFSEGDTPKKVLPYRGRFRERSVEYGLELPKNPAVKDTNTVIEKTITVDGKKSILSNWKLLLVFIVLLVSILAYFLLL